METFENEENHESLKNHLVFDYREDFSNPSNKTLKLSNDSVTLEDLIETIKVLNELKSVDKKGLLTCTETSADIIPNQWMNLENSVPNMINSETPTEEMLTDINFVMSAEEMPTVTNSETSNEKMPAVINFVTSVEKMPIAMNSETSVEEMPTEFQEILVQPQVEVSERPSLLNSDSPHSSNQIDTQEILVQPQVEVSERPSLLNSDSPQSSNRIDTAILITNHPEHKEIDIDEISGTAVLAVSDFLKEMRNKVVNSPKSSNKDVLNNDERFKTQDVVLKKIKDKGDKVPKKIDKCNEKNTCPKRPFSFETTRENKRKCSRFESDIMSEPKKSPHIDRETLQEKNTHAFSSYFQDIERRSPDRSYYDYQRIKNSVRRQSIPEKKKEHRKKHCSSRSSSHQTESEFNISKRDSSAIKNGLNSLMSAANSMPTLMLLQILLPKIDDLSLESREEFKMLEFASRIIKQKLQINERKYSR